MSYTVYESEQSIGPGETVAKNERDIPEEFHKNALDAIAGFNSVVKEYSILLETQRKRLLEGDYAGVELLTSRGDRLARDARAYGQHLSSLGSALMEGGFNGPDARAVVEKIDLMRRRSEATGEMVQQVIYWCKEAMQSRAEELAAYNVIIPGFETRCSHSEGEQTGSLRVGYQLDRSASLLIDTVR